MTKSIRLRLFAGISFLIMFFVLLAWILNTHFLGDYYRIQKTHFLVDTAKQIKDIYKGNPEDIYTELESLEHNAGVHILIINSTYRVKYALIPRMDPITRERTENLLNQVLIKPDELKEKGSIIYITRDPFKKSDSLNLVVLLKNKDYLILSTPLAAIEDNAAIANRFFFFTGILTLLIGSLMAFLFAKQFTRPILELNEIAQRMTKLDFSKKYQGSSEDELDELGSNINCLSDQLSQSISELQESNAKLKEDIEQERRIDEMRKEFISNVSHELKTPISLIQGYAEGLKVNVIEDEENKNYYCDVIIDEAVKMNKLVMELLDLSHIESGQFRLEKSIYDLSSQVDRILTKYEPVWKEKNIKPLVIKYNSIMVNADIIRTEQVLVNYINNAINHIDHNKVLRINIDEHENKIRVSVFNSGKAIPSDALDKIFTSFYKVDKARTRAYGGSGLGLSVVKAIQELDGNAFGVTNLDNGVKFWFELDQAE